MSDNTPALDTPATPTAVLVLTPPSESAIVPLRTELSLVADRLLRRPDTLEWLIKKHLKSLSGPQRLEWMAEVSDRTQERGEVAACSARVIKRIVEGWTDKELEEMGVTRVAAEEKVGLHIGLIPLAELDTGIKRRRRHSERRISGAWGDEWEIDLKKILPKCPSETFLRELAVFAEEHTFEWSKVFFQHQIQARINRPRSRKDSWLTSRDLVMDRDLATWQKRRITEVEEEDDDASSLSAGEGKAETPKAEERNTRAVLTPGKSGKLPLSSPPPQHAATGPSSSSTGSSQPPAQNPEPVAPRRKRKAESGGERQVKCRKEVKIRVMNLDVQEKLREMEETAEKDNNEQKHKDMPFVRKALIELGERYKDEMVSREVWERRAAMFWEALSLEIE